MTRMDASRWRVVLLCCVAILSSIVVHGHEEVPVEYGADVSFPSQHKNVTTNYPWLEHNTDHSSTVQVPKEYEGMVLQPLGERQTFYDNYIQGCIDHFGPKKAARCRQNEADRVAMTLRQPMSMQNYVSFPKTDGIDSSGNRLGELIWNSSIRAFNVNFCTIFPLSICLYSFITIDTFQTSLSLKRRINTSGGLE